MKLKSLIKKSLLILALAFSFSTLTPVAVYGCAPGDADYPGCTTTLPPADPTCGFQCGMDAAHTPEMASGDMSSIVNNIVNVLLFVIGAVSVIMIIVGGIKYSTAAGDAGKIATAKNTVMYAVVGLVVAILAFAIVNFVFNSIR